MLLKAVVNILAQFVIWAVEAERRRRNYSTTRYRTALIVVELVSSYNMLCCFTYTHQFQS